MGIWFCVDQVPDKWTEKGGARLCSHALPAPIDSVLRHVSTADTMVSLGWHIVIAEDE